jgi:thioesterase domain-containing protein
MIMSPEPSAALTTDNPVGRSMGQAARALSLEEKRALLGQLLRARADQPRHALLSAAQERLWLVHELEPESSVHNVSVVHSFTGPLDGDLLERSLGEVVGRHESLRTTFTVVDGGPVQRIGPPAFELARSDQSTLSGAEWASAVEQAAREEARTPFDLERGPLLRCKLLSRSPREHALIITVHHLVADRWSLGILAREASRLYAAYTAGEPPPFPHTPPPYTVFGDWHRDWLQCPEADRQRAYWIARLGGPVTELRLPSDRSATGAPSYAGDRKEFSLGDALTREVAERSAAEGVTPYVSLLAAFAALLRQRTGQEDVVICSPVAGRHRPRTKGIVGYFNNLVPLRIDLTGELSYRELLGRVSHEARQAYDAQDIPFQWIAELPNLVRIPLTRCLFSLQNTPSLAFELPGVVADYEDVPGGTANFDMAVFFEERQGHLAGIIDYKTDLFTASAIDRLVDQYQEVLLQLLGRPDTCPCKVAPPAPARQQTEQRLNGVAPPSPDSTCDPECQSRNETSAAPRERLEQRLTEIWQEVLGVKPISPTGNFFELGGHSLLAARLFSRLEQELAQELPLAMLLRAPTIREMAQLLADGGWADLWSSLVPVQPNGSRPPIFFMHAGGGAVLTYRLLSQYLGADQPVWGLQARGLSGAATPARRVEEMAEQYLRALRSVQPHGPYRLGGYSFGALVALEIAQQLKAREEEVALLLLLDYPGPASKPGWKDRLRWHWICLSQLEPKDKLLYIAKRIAWRVKSDRHLPRSLRLLFSGAFLGRKGMTKASYRVRMMESTVTAIQDYRIRPYPGRVTLFRALNGPPSLQADAHGGWSSTALGGVEVHDIPGGHMNLLAEPSVRLVAECLTKCLDRALAPEMPSDNDLVLAPEGSETTDTAGSQV